MPRADRNLKPPSIKVYTLCPMNLPIKDMTLQEKLAAMELLWEDLTRSPESFESPDWHKDILEERRRESPKGKLISWIGRLLNKASAPKCRENRNPG